MRVITLKYAMLVAVKYLRSGLKMKMQQSLVLIKPDGTVRRATGAAVLETLLDKGYDIKAFKEMKVPESLARAHYDVHSEKPFFPWLVDFITSAPILAMIVEGDDAIQGIRTALGATFVQEADSDSLRGKYGIWAGINLAHASDSPKTAEKEIKLWKEQGGLTESEDAYEKARDYIEKYGFLDEHTTELRNVVKKAIENESTSDEMKKIVEHILEKDAKDIAESDIEALSSTIHDFILEEVEE
ncbi:MAG: hypothetical protein GF309_03805 [Candidatus Lokiarchaeota archaeon]|nr:hypothetical protein [Candidatus Lokiarchaeota archaeon]